uniref:hypothetical protein n=1 Tax=Massilia oculi TaxID=945844 RepID=UPI0036D3D3B7
MTLREIERVLYFEAYVVTSQGLTPLERRQLLTEEQYLTARQEYNDDFDAAMGAEAVSNAAAHDRPAVGNDRLREEIASTRFGTKLKRITKASS